MLCPEEDHSMPEQQTAPRNKRLTRRRAPKHSTRAVCYTNALGLGKSIAQSVLDVSETGARLVLKAELKVGKQVLLELEGVSRRTVKVLAQLVWILPTSEKTFCAGFKFEKSIDWGALLMLSAT
jgi:hypothetical protein